MDVLYVIPPGAGEIHVPPRHEPGDGTERPADSQQVPAHPRQGSVPQEPATKRQGTDSPPRSVNLVVLLYMIDYDMIYLVLHYKS